MEYCVLCGDEVDAKKWRQHIDEKHELVSQKPMKNSEGVWIRFVANGPLISDEYKQNPER